MTVPDEAIEAAVKAWDHHWGDRYGDEALEEMGEEVRVALEVAAPYLRAQALEDASDGFDKACKMVRDNTYVDSGIYHDLVQQARGLETAAETLRARAAAERGPDV